MAWIIFFIVSLLITSFLVPVKILKKIWPAGILGLIVILFIDNALSSLNAFKFHHLWISVLGLPLFYWLSYFTGGIFLAYYRPTNKRWSLVYVLVFSIVYLTPELFFVYLGYFSYINWNPFKSFFLNMGGFIIFFWLTEWLSSIIFIPSRKTNK